MAGIASIPEEIRRRLAQREAELAILNSVQQGLASHLDIQAIYELVGDKLGEIFKDRDITLALYDRGQDRMHFPYLLESGQRSHPEGIQPGPIGRRVITESIPLIFHSAQEFNDVGAVVIPGTSSSLSGIFAPLRSADGVFGTLSVESKEENAFSDSDLRLLEILANSTSVALQNARLLDETRQHNAELAIINNVQAGLAKNLDLRSIVNLVGEKIGGIFSADTVSVCLYDADTDSAFDIFYMDRGKIIQIPEGPLNRPGLMPTMIDTRKPLLMGTAEEGVELGAIRIAGESGVDQNESYLGVPIMLEDRPIGAVSVQSYQKNAYDDGDVQLLQTLASSMSVALQNARLLEETRRRNAELAIINNVQEGLARRLDLQSIINLVGDKLGEIFRADSVSVGLYNDADDTRSHVYYRDRGQLIHLADGPLNRPSLTALMMDTHQPLLLGTAQEGIDLGSVRIARNGEEDRNESFLGVPILLDGHSIGSASVQSYQQHAYDEADLRLLQTLASSMSVALENARLFDETQRLLKETEEHNAELAIINSVQEGLASNLNMRAIYELVGDKVREIFHADTTYIATYHPEEQVTISQYYVEKGHHYTFPPFPMGQGLYTPVIRSRQPLLIGTSREQAEHGAIIIPSPGSTEDLNETFLGVPILLGSEVKGIISIQSYRQNAYDEGDVRLLQTLANSMSAALENARLLDETQRRASELATVNSVSTALAGELELQSLIELIGEKIRSAFNADIAYVAMLDEQTNIISFPYIHGEQLDPMQYGQGLTSKVIQSGKPLLINQEMERQRAELGATPIGRRARSYLAVPILIGGKAIGVISVQNTEQENVFTEDDQRLLGTIAANVGVALQNARLFDEIRNRNRMITESLEQQTATSDVLKVMAASPTNVQPVLDAIAEHARKLCNGVFSAVYLTDGAMIDEVARSNFQPEAIEESRKWYPAPLSRDTSLSSRTVLDRAVLHLTDMRDYSDLPPLTQSTASKLNMRSVLFVPLLREGEGIGSIGVGRTHSEPFTEKQIALMQTFASQAVIAIENVRLFDEVTRRKEHFEALFASNPVAVVTVDNEAMVTSWNPSAEKLFGYTPEEALNRNVDDLVAKSSELHKQAEAYSRKGLDIRSDPFQVIVKRTRKDGSLVDVELSAVPIVVQGRKVGMFALYHDITELQRARLDAIDANEAKSAFLATMSHEIRTPMNAVIGMSSLLMDTTLSKEQREYAETIRSSGDALLAIINDILDFSKIEAGRMELEHQPFDLRECVESALDLVAGRAVEKNIELAYIFEEGVPAGVNGDVTRLRQVLLNLLSNAVKFTGQGEVVLTVSTASHVPGLPALQDADALYFSVRDTGIGIPRSQMNRLFESFSQADSSTTRRYGGTGLGLAISKRLAEMMGGSMWASSAGDGAGSTFSFSIVAPPAAIESRKSERVSAGLQPALEGKRVLIVDDNATNRRILMLQTEKWGMHPHASEFPREALKRLKAGETFDLAILDLQMPDMDGLMLTREIRKLKNGKSLPIILLTSLGRREVETGDLQFAAFLSKPLKPSSLLDALAGIFAPRRAAPVPAPMILDPSRAQRLPLRILLAEDNAVNQKLALRLLEQMGYRADVASNGLEAVECLQRQPYDLVLMDVQMPEMDGLEATRAIRKLRGLLQPRIAAMTANALQGDREMCIAAGMDDYISKPIRIPELVEVLNNTSPVKAPRNGRPARKKPAAPREKTATPKAKKPRAANKSKT